MAYTYDTVMSYHKIVAIVYAMGQNISRKNAVKFPSPKALKREVVEARYKFLDIITATIIILLIQF